jgi:hypothetical protein
MYRMTKGYELNEKDIDSVLNWLKINRPELAYPEFAIDMLEELHAVVHTASHEEPENLDNMHTALNRVIERRKQEKLADK